MSKKSKKKTKVNSDILKKKKKKKKETYIVTNGNSSIFPFKYKEQSAEVGANKSAINNVPTVQLMLN